MTDPLGFALAALILLAAPGPTNALICLGAATLGARRALLLALAALTAYSLAIGLLLTVLQTVLAALPWLGNAVAMVVAAYLLVLAWRLWQTAAGARTAGARITPSRVFMVTLFNPKAFVLAFSILPRGDAALHWYLLALAGIIALVALGWLLLGVLIGAAAGAGHERRLNRLSSVVLAAFAGVILWRVLQGWLA
jgi:threonine/homoserine/homoserine lactone efflux protein